MRTAGRRAGGISGWIDASVFHRVSAAAVGLALAVLALVGAGSYALSLSLLRRAIGQQLDAEEALAAAFLGRGLSDLVRDVGQLARNPLLATALVDPEGRGRFAEPLVRSFRPSVPGAVRVALTDRSGRILAAASTPEAPSLSGLGWVEPVVERQRSHAELHVGSGRAHVFLAYPIVPPGSGRAVSALVAEVSLDALQDSIPAGKIEGSRHVLLDASGGPIVGSAAGDGAGWIRRVTALDLPPPLGALGLRVGVFVPAAAAFAPLRWLTLGYAVFSLLVLGLAILGSRRVADRLMRPVRDLNVAIGQIASSGSLDAHVPVQGADEIAQLAGSFNQMLGKLREAQAAASKVHRAESQRTRSALRIALLAIERASEAILIAGPDGTVVFANDAAARLAGLEGTLLATLKLWELDRWVTEESWKRDWALLKERGSLSRERTLAGPGGSSVNIEISDSYLGADDLEYCVSVRRDVTARRQAEVALRLAGVGTLAAGAAHEINNPLAFIGANMAFLRETLERLRSELVPAVGSDALAAELAEAIRAARESEEGTRRIRDIVAGLKAFTRRPDDRREPVDPRQAVEAAIALARNEIRHRARLSTQLAADVPAVVANRHRIEQVVMNLLVNAAQAIPEGQGDASAIAVAVSRSRSGEAVIEVSDTGSGMTPEVRAHLFEPFFTTKPVGAGTGLGLYVCHGIVSELGGRIEVESEAGRGSSFRVFLPGGGEVAAEAKPPATAAAIGGRVLVIDDDASVGAAIRRLLSEQEVVLSVNAREALERIRTGESVDLVLCDLMMPGMSGIEFHSELYRVAPDLAREMVFITGGAFTPRARAFLDDSRNAFIEKPFEPELLRSIVAQKLVGRRPR